MFELDPILLGSLFFLLGLGVVILTLFFLRTAPKPLPISSIITKSPTISESDHHNEAVILIQSGGQIAYLNQKARELFGLPEDKPNLESLACRTRPNDEFLKICASEGRTQLIVNGHYVDGTSYFFPLGIETKQTNIMLVTLCRHQLVIDFSSELESDQVQDYEEINHVDFSPHVVRFITELNQTIISNLDLEKTLQVIFETVKRLLPSDFLEIAIWEKEHQQFIPYRLLGLAGVDDHLDKVIPQSHIDKGYKSLLVRHQKPLFIKDAHMFCETHPEIDEQRYPFHSYLGVPLIVADELIGTLELASLGREIYKESDLGILKLISTQASAAISNALLYEQEQKQAAKIVNLASLTKSVNTNLDPGILFHQLIEIINDFIPVEILGFLIYDENQQVLKGKAPFVGIRPSIIELYQTKIRPGSPAEALWQRAEIIRSHYAPEDEHIRAFELHHIAQAAGIHETVLVPLLSNGNMFGYLQAANKKDGTPFDNNDVWFLEIVAGQVAPIIENALLIPNIEQNTLVSSAIKPSRVYTQTEKDLRQKMERLTALLRVNRELNTTLELETLGQRLYDEVLIETKADCGTVLIFDLVSNNNSQSRQLTSLETPRVLFHFGDDPGMELHPLESAVLRELKTIIIDDFLESTLPIHPEFTSAQTSSPVSSKQTDSLTTPIFFPAHDSIRSALITPISYQGQVFGLIHLHAKKPGQFKEDDLESVETLATQAAIALGNAQRFQEQLDRNASLQQRLETLSTISDVFEILQIDQPLEQSLQTIAYAFQSSTPFDKVIISLYDPKTNRLVSITGAGISPEEMDSLRSNPPLWEEIQNLIQTDTWSVRSNFTTKDGAPLNNIPFQGQNRSNGSKSWQAGDTLFIPLFRTNDEPLGLINLDSARDNLPYDYPISETQELFSRLISPMIESQLNVRDLHTQIEHLEEDLDLAHQITQETNSQLPALLEKEHEQTLSILNLNQQASRIKTGLEIAEIVSQQTERMQALKKLGQEILERMGFDIVLIAEPNKNSLKIIHKMGIIPEIVNPTALLGQHNPLRRCLQSGEYLFVSNILEDSEWQGTVLLRAMETRSFICFPINEITNNIPTQSNQETAEDISLHHQKPGAAVLAISQNLLAPFTNNDNQLFKILSHQVAVSLQNLNLLNKTSQRLRETNLLLAFTRRLGSLDPMSILHALMENALHATPAARRAIVAIYEPQSGILLTKAASGYSDNDGLLKTTYQPGEGLPGQIFQEKRALLIEEVDFPKHYNFSPDNFIQYHKATSGELPISSIGTPIMSGTVQFGEAGKPSTIDFQNRNGKDDLRAVPLGVIILDNDQISGAFTQDDLTVLSSLAQQTALSLENARLYQSSKHQSDQLQSLTRISTAISSSLQAEDLIASLLDQLQEILSYDTGTLWLRHKQNRSDRMIIQAARGFEDRDKRIGLTIDIQDSQLLDEMIHTSKPIWVPNVSKDERFRGLNLDNELEEEISPALQDSSPIGYEHMAWLGVPLIASGEVIGVIALEKREQNFYTSDDIQVAATFAGQAAIGLENARLYQESINRAIELDQQSQTLLILNRLSSGLSRSLEISSVLDIAAHELLQILPCTSVSVLRFDYDSSSQPTMENAEKRSVLPSVILQTEHSQLALNKNLEYQSGAKLPISPLIERLVDTEGIFNTDNISQESDLEPLYPFLDRHNTRSLLIVPIISRGTIGKEDKPLQHFHGMLLAHNNKPYRFSPDEVALAHTISNQVAISIQNARLFEETRGLKDDLEFRVEERTAELAREHYRAETLLRIITELSASLDLDQVLESTLQVLGEYVDAGEITILLAKPGEKELKRLASAGYFPEPDDISGPLAFDMDEGLAGWIIKQRESLLVNNVREDDRWRKILYSRKTGKTIIQHTSLMGVPLMIGSEALGCILLFHPQESHFSLDQLDMVQAAANQVAVAVNNAELYRLIRDQAEDLDNMLRNQQIETSRSRAILEAVADGVLVTDSINQITLFNASAENILGLKRTHVISKSMELFSGMFGRATHSWLDKIKTWSEDPSSYQPGDSYAEKFTLEDDRVIYVHLAPVILRNDFLGTVSIFQDITHQVEIDRFKSEFVATVSHELRTPMTSIKGYVEILLLGAAGKLTPQQENFLKVVQMNSERLSILVNDLLDVSQIEAGKISLSITPLSLEDIVDQAILGLKNRIEDYDKQVSIEKEIQVNLPPVLGDSEHVRRILDNLLDNAYQYNSDEGLIIIRMNHSGEKVQVDIKDNGVGIHPDDQERIFERFFRGENSIVLEISGTGLGLSIVKNLVEMQNGEIWMESKGIPGVGSTFSFTLPVYKPEKDRIKE